jgi:hypothetical protein
LTSFADTLRGLADQRGLSLPAASHPEPLAGLDYAVEHALKQAALDLFWKAEKLPGHPAPIVAAPVPRAYRTTSKRRGGTRALSLTGSSALDRADHAAVYAFVAKEVDRDLASELSWVIVRGAAPALAVILNVRRFDGDVIRAGKRLAEALQESTLGVRAGFLYLDPTGSEYYLEAKRPEGLSFKRLFGPEWLQVEVGGIRLRHPPTAFSQVNGAMLDGMVESARGLLAPTAACDLLDLYCGYGLFSLTLGRAAGQVVGVDLDGPAIDAARANAEHLRSGRRVRFLAGRIDGRLLAGVRPARGAEVVLLDPPRQGTVPGVIEAIAARAPHRIVHICCGTDEIPREVAAWKRAGFEVAQVVPLDLFAGTANLETMLLLMPSGHPPPQAR